MDSEASRAAKLEDGAGRRRTESHQRGRKAQNRISSRYELELLTFRHEKVNGNAFVVNARVSAWL